MNLVDVATLQTNQLVQDREESSSRSHSRLERYGRARSEGASSGGRTKNRHTPIADAHDHVPTQDLRGPINQNRDARTNLIDRHAERAKEQQRHNEDDRRRSGHVDDRPNILEPPPKTGVQNTRQAAVAPPPVGDHQRNNDRTTGHGDRSRRNDHHDRNKRDRRGRD